jgi:hypothetical protein
MTEVDLADARGDVKPDEGEPGHRRFQPRVDAAPVVDDLDADAPRHDDRDASPV